MEKEIKYFGGEQSGLDADSADFAVAPNDWVNAENVRTGTTDNGVTKVVESVASTRLISTPQPSVTFLQIGAVDDKENRRILYFKKNTTGPWDKIVCCYIDTEIEYDVLLSSQVADGLNFSKDSIIHSAKVVDGKLYWADSTNNQPRKINIDAGIKANDSSFQTEEEAYVFPLRFDEVTLIKPPPPLSPNITKKEDATFNNNFIAPESFMFAFQFVYEGEETTVLGTYSPASRLNFHDEDNNYVEVVMDAVQQIPSTVKIVNLIARLQNSNNAFIVKQWDRSVTSELADITAHNAGTTQLQFDFYNNITGEVIPSAPINMVLKPFDSVPIYAETIELFRNRLALSNNTEGYDTPKVSSLSTELVDFPVNGTTIQLPLIQVRHRRRGISDNPDINGYAYVGWFIYSSGGSIPAGYYSVNGTEVSTITPSSLPPYPSFTATPTTVAISGLTFRGNTQSQVIQNTLPAGAGVVPPGMLSAFTWSQFTIEQSFTTTVSSLTITGATITNYGVFPSRTQRKLSVVFYDFAMRKCGVVDIDVTVNVPDRDFEFSTGYGSILWTLSNSNCLNEIPEWAYYYTVVCTDDLTTRSYVESYTNAAKYVTRDTAGKFQFSSTIVTIGTIGVGLHTAAMIQSGLGYVFTEGDICVLTRDDDTVYELPVMGQDGNYIIVKTDDIGDLNNRQFTYKIYTPYKTSEQEPYYEVGNLYRILEPTTTARSYETISDYINSDAYVLTRNYLSATYFAQAMSPNDLFFQRRYTDAGKPNFKTKLGQVVKKGYIRWSNTLIPNTAVNGLSTFDALDQKELPSGLVIRKLQLTSKVQGEMGTVLLAICETETVSLYIGEVQQYDARGSANLVVSDNVIGSFNVLKGGYGTVNPESVSEFKGNVYWYDALNGKLMQYSSNGLFPISNVKMTRFWKLFSDQYLSMTSAEIEELGSRPFVFTTVDPHHYEFLVSVPKLLSTPPKGFLIDYPSTVYPFDAYDGQAKAIIYKLDLGAGNPHFQGSYSFTVDGFVSAQNKLFSFKQGHLYIHNDTSSFNNFHGVQYKSRIMFVANGVPNVPKVYKNIAIEANLLPTLTYMLSEQPYLQATDIMDYEYSAREGVYYAPIKRNKIVPTATGMNTSGLMSAEEMRTPALRVMLEFTVTTTPLQLRAAIVGFNVSKGHTNILPK